MSSGKKTIKKPGKKKGKAREWFINILAISLLGGTLVFIAFMSMRMGANDTEKDKYLASLPAQTDTISHSKVCMVDDIYQGDYPTLPIPILNTTYFGCDHKATRDLLAKPELRVAIDPITKRTVDKALGIIAIDPKRDGKVLYFESMVTFSQYLNNLQE